MKWLLFCTSSILSIKLIIIDIFLLFLLLNYNHCTLTIWIQIPIKINLHIFLNECFSFNYIESNLIYFIINTIVIFLIYSKIKINQLTNQSKKYMGKS